MCQHGSPAAFFAGKPSAFLNSVRNSGPSRKKDTNPPPFQKLEAPNRFQQQNTGFDGSVRSRSGPRVADLLKDLPCRSLQSPWCSAPCMAGDLRRGFGLGGVARRPGPWLMELCDLVPSGGSCIGLKRRNPERPSDENAALNDGNQVPSSSRSAS